MAYYLSEFIGDGSELDPFRPPVDGQSGIIDLRGDTTAQVGRCLFWAPADLPADNRYEKVADSTVESIPRNIARRIENALGVSLDQFDTLQAIIAELLILHGSFTDPDRWNPLRANRFGRHVIHLGGKVYDAPAPVGATVSDDFDRADASTLGAAWDDPSSAYGIDTNRAAQEADGDGRARYETDLSSDDHFSEVTDMNSGGSTTAGSILRVSSSEETYYMARINLSDHIRMFKIVTGTFTKLFEGSSLGLSSPYTVDFYFEFDGSAWDVQIDAVSEASGTDTSITGNTRAGLWGGSTTTDFVYYGSWQAQDLGAAAFTGTSAAVQADQTSSASGTLGAVFPDAPPNVTAVAQSDTEILVSWDAVSGADAYDVERDSVVVADKVAGLSFSDTGLDASTQYSYRVRAARTP